MKKKTMLLLVVIAFLLFSPLSLLANNGAPSGTHYNLNLIGVPKGKTAAMDNNEGHRIFVNLDGNTKINLGLGDTFAVLDANGTDANGARFQLPNPDPANSGNTLYSVYARALGKPGANGRIATCATQDVVDPITGAVTSEEVCSLTTLSLARSKGKSVFENVSRELLYIFADLNGDGIAERYPLFDEALHDYFWSYDNNGLKVVQLRFYPVSTNVN